MMAANPHRGEVELRIGGATFTLRFTIGAICAMEARIGRSFADVSIAMGEPDRFTITGVRDLLHTALQDAHGIHLVEAGELILAAGGLVAVLAKVTASIECSFPKPDAAAPTVQPSANLQKVDARAQWDWSALLAQWVSLGLDDEAFWLKTPEQVRVVLKSKSIQLAREHNARAWLAWHIAALPRQKKLPDLKRMMVTESASPRRRQTPEEQEHIWMVMAAASKAVSSSPRG